MVVLKHGWSEEIALSLFTKESVFDTAETINDTNFCSLEGFEAEVSWPDVLESDKAEVTGKEHGTDQERMEQHVNITVNEAHAKPNTVAGLSALALGTTSATQDGAFTAYRHDNSPIAVGSALPSTSVLHQKGGLKYIYTGVKANSFSITGEAGGAVKMGCEMIGSGTRATDATAMPSVITEEWLLLRNCKVWLETGAAITITTPGTQEVEDISSATPEDLNARIKSFSWKWNNNLERQSSFGSATGVAQDIDKGRRTCELSFDLLFNDSTELDYFINQDPAAVEFDLFGSLIDAGGAFKYGLELFVPRFKLKAAPVASGGVDDILMVTLDCEVFDDGTNDASLISVYTAQTAYLA